MPVSNAFSQAKGWHRHTRSKTELCCLRLQIHIPSSQPHQVALLGHSLEDGPMDVRLSTQQPLDTRLFLHLFEQPTFMHLKAFLNKGLRCYFSDCSPVTALQSGFYDHQGLRKFHFRNKVPLVNSLFQMESLLCSIIYGNRIDKFGLAE